MQNNLKTIGVGIQGNAMNILFSKVILFLMIVLPFSLFYSYFSISHSTSFLFYLSLNIQVIISACMGFSYLVSLVLTYQNYTFFKNNSQSPFYDTFVSLADIYRSILPVSIVGKEKICYSISFFSYLSSAFVLNFEISIMATSFLLISLSQLHLLINCFIISSIQKKTKHNSKT